MKIAVLIPDRGDRPEFMHHALTLISSQTIQPDLVQVVNFPAESDEKDITKRYRIGYDSLRNQNLDAILLWENDDYYAPNYIETVISAWNDVGRPDLFGQRSTIYYHIGVLGHFTMRHEQRSSAMSTLIRPDLNFKWCPDSEPYTDMWLYTQLKYSLFQPETVISIGIKHGIGLTGGGSHVTDLSRFTNPPHGNPDPEMKWLREHVTPKSFEFYESLHYHII